MSGSNRIWRRGCAVLLLAIVAILVWSSARLAAIRLYQVDECQNVFMARVLATGQASVFFTYPSLFLVGLLAPLAHYASHSVALFDTARFLFLAIFWLNLLLMGAIGGRRLLSLCGLFALVAAATLAPLWDYGFEIRHDNLILAGLLLIWWAVRVRAFGVYSFALAGAVTVAALFVAVKSVVYMLPLSLAILAFPPPQHKTPRRQLILAWAAGAIGAVILVRLLYGTGGAWQSYFSVFRNVAAYSATEARPGQVERFWPWSTLGRLPAQTPLLLALCLAACAATALQLARQPKSSVTWDSDLPEVLLLLGALAALLANPTPYPYNLLNVVPFAFLLAFRYGLELRDLLRTRRRLWPLAGAVLVTVHLVPFVVATSRHFQRTNTRQRALMQLAESLTDPVSDPVYDAVGMVPTRPGIDFHWYLHSLNMYLTRAPGHHVRDLLAAKPAAVFIPNYRTDWLPPEDHDFIRRRYVPLADDFWVLGCELPPGGGVFNIVHAGRYCITALQPTNQIESGAAAGLDCAAAEAQGFVPGTLDGVPLARHAVQLSAGAHRVETTGDCHPMVVWVGPRLDGVPRLAAGNHRSLFVNWY
jgi:hypothetical protein